MKSYRTPQIYCEDCGLHKRRKNCVWGSGCLSTACTILVGEAPGGDEDVAGEAFVGRSGELLRGAVAGEFTEIVFDVLFICNLLQCRPPNNRNPRRNEIEACAPWLKYKLTRSPAKVVVCLGSIAAAELIGPDFERGKWYRKNKKLMIATYHPSYVLRNQDNKKVVENFKKWLFMGIRAGIREGLGK